MSGKKASQTWANLIALAVPFGLGAAMWPFFSLSFCVGSNGGGN